MLVFKRIIKFKTTQNPEFFKNLYKQYYLDYLDYLDHLDHPDYSESLNLSLTWKNLLFDFSIYFINLLYENFNRLFYLIKNFNFFYIAK